MAISVFMTSKTGSIQLIAKKENFSETDWASFPTLRVGMRVSACGMIGKSKRGQVSVFLIRLPTVHDTLASPIAGAPPDYAHVGTLMFVARLRNRVTEFLRRRGYVEIEPRFISTEWASRGVEPLEVVYPGFGSSAYLATTPAPQLVDALVATGAGAVFAQSRCFSTTFRDEKSSVESVIVCAKALGVSSEEQYEVLRKCVIHSFGDLETVPTSGPFPPESWREVNVNEGLADPTGSPVEVPTLEIYPAPGIGSTHGGIKVLELYRLVWPPRRTIAEGAQEQLGDLKLASTTIHIERMADLLKDVPVRTIRNLGFGGSAS
jgi:hypothetical protein